MSDIKIPTTLASARAVKFHPATTPIKPAVKTAPKPADKPVPPLQIGDGSTPVKNAPALVKGSWSTLPKPTPPAQATLPAKKDPELEDMTLHWPYPSTQIGTFKLGTIVKINPVISQEKFQIGERLYPYAIIIAIEPKIILASRDGEGRWEEGPHFSRGTLLHCGEAKMQVFNKAKERLEK